MAFLQPYHPTRHVSFFCLSGRARGIFILTLAQLRSWNKRGGLRKFLARGGCIRSHHFDGPRSFEPDLYWLWNPRDDSYTEIRTRAEMDEAYRRVDQSDMRARVDDSWNHVFRIVRRVSVEEQQSYIADLLQALAIHAPQEKLNIVSLYDSLGWTVAPNGETWRWVYKPSLKQR